MPTAQVESISLTPQLFMCAAMTKDDIEQTLDAADRAFAKVAKERSQIESADPLIDVPAQDRQEA